MNPIDQLVGKRIRARRKALGWSQAHLADKIGVTFQQLQKYENGVNKVAASRLHTLAQALGVELEFFFDITPVTDNGPDLLSVVLDDDEFKRLNATFQRIKSVRLRRSIIAMIEAVEDEIERKLGNGRAEGESLR